MHLFHAKKRFTLTMRTVVLTVMAILLATAGLLPVSGVHAEGTTVTSMSYYSSADGPVISKSGVGQASYGFVMPIFNGGSAA